MRITTLGFLLLAACSKSSTPSTVPPEPVGEEKPSPAVDPEGRPQMLAAACEAQGGKVVGDIGDGATQQPDYHCPDSGEAPIGSIVPDPGGPAAIEGAVCCK